MQNMDMEDEFGPFRGQIFKYGHAYTKSLKDSRIMAKVTQLNAFSRDVLSKRLYVILQSWAQENVIFFFLNTMGLRLKFVDIWSAWGGGQNPLISPLVYAQNRFVF